MNFLVSALRRNLFTAFVCSAGLLWGHAQAAAPSTQWHGTDVFATGAEVSAGIDAVSADGTLLDTEWKVLAEATDLRKGGDHETPPTRIAVRVLQAGGATVR